ncbi:toxin ParE1/3/4 [Paraburkholderia sp. RAU2J]|uniref:type II toxin-antitoxin system RelE/ParE family toxin n=1 Tax=Paraburkholderia sp. RAU2J TaxID=1938810 RepID=UPI000EB4EE50|nr:type II toxin-antitoxin system RelE/ParE family toxin [Paraburkholderia sp. RAU2J]RKT10356.1 toxin ParE1/3/4 [Paraburkholderia sp. RAU2J]
MSHPEYRLELAAEAQDDFEDILLHTLLTWGERQMQAYGDLLDRSLSTIRTNPNIGHVHPFVRDPYKCFQAGQHLIFYRVQDVTVFVVRILHSRMDPASRLD